MTLDVMVLLTSVNWSSWKLGVPSYSAQSLVTRLQGQRPERSDPDHSDLEFRFCALVPARYFRWRHSLDSLETGYVFVADSISYWPSSITAFMVFIRILRQNADRLTAAAEKFFFICVKSTYCQLSVCLRCSARARSYMQMAWPISSKLAEWKCERYLEVSSFTALILNSLQCDIES